VYSEKTPDDGQRNCPKHVEFYSKNKCEKLVHLIGFIIRICHDARSPERQITSDITTQVVIVQVQAQEKVKVKLTLEQATKAQRESRGIAVLFL